MRNDKIDESIQALKNRYGKHNGLAFTDESAWPLGGENLGKRLKHIPTDFWIKFVEDNDYIPKERLAERGGQYQTYLGKLLAYGRRRVKEHQQAKKRANKNKDKRGKIYITDGKITKTIDPKEPMPIGFWKGDSRKKNIQWDDARKKKASEGVKRYLNSPRSKEHRDKLSKAMPKKSIMKKHTKIYLKHFGYGTEDFIPCELTGKKAVDIHHIVSRGAGGSRLPDDIINLMAITRDLHQEYGDKKKYMEFLVDAHNSFLETKTPFIEIDPNNVGFDVLLNLEQYKDLVKWHRLKS